MKKILSSVALMTVASMTMAADVDTSLLVKSLNPTAKIEHVKPSVIPGLYEVQINNQVVYLSADGEKVISGDIYDLKKKVSYTDQTKNGLRKQAIASVADKDKIIYKAKDEKYKITVFTDITCPYCSKLHSHMPEFNEAGVTVEYLAFPRAGIGSKAQKNMQKIWCAKDKALALNAAKNDNKLPSKSCQGNQVMEQFLLGQDIGVNATPTMILSDGEIQPGYADPKELLNYLKEKTKS